MCLCVFSPVPSATAQDTWSWDQYLKEQNASAAPIELFSQVIYWWSYIFARSQHLGELIITLFAYSRVHQLIWFVVAGKWQNKANQSLNVSECVLRSWTSEFEIQCSYLPAPCPWAHHSVSVSLFLSFLIRTAGKVPYLPSWLVERLKKLYM